MQTKTTYLPIAKLEANDYFLFTKVGDEQNYCDKRIEYVIRSPLNPRERQDMKTTDIEFEESFYNFDEYALLSTDHAFEWTTTDGRGHFFTYPNSTQIRLYRDCCKHPWKEAHLRDSNGKKYVHYTAEEIRRIEDFDERTAATKAFEFHYAMLTR